ncbi:hypothetical protein BDR05DRAFT_1003138 [Suillus weaverae]|nr:hypothetical protein BDR05DRAFT_1003138 [Suillus weaverae]
MAPDLRVFIHEERIFTSFHASLHPAVIPPIPRPWNPVLESDSFSDNIRDTLTTHAIFGCLNHSYYSIPIEATPDGRYILCKDIREEWQILEQHLTWCQGCLSANMHLPWYCQPPRAPRDYRYLRSHINVNLAKKVALRSSDAFIGTATLCTYFIMAHQYRPHNGPSDWTTLLTKDPQCPIPSAWVVELSRTFVGDLTDAMPCTGTIINSAYGLGWDTDVAMFERFKVPIWVYWASNMVHHRAWKNYLPSATDIGAVQRNDKWGIESGWGTQFDNNAWGPKNDGNLSNDDSWGNDLWDTLLNDLAPASIVQSQPDLSHFPLPKKNSGQKHGEDFKAFFTRRAMQNKEKEEKEMPSQQQARLGCERSATNHHIPGRSSTTQVFEWRPDDDDDEEDRFLLHHPVTKACIEGIWGDYSKDTRVFDAFSNQWDLCCALNPTSIPDGDDQEDDDDIMPLLPITAPSVLPPPTPSSFLRDIYKYFGNEVSLASRHTTILPSLSGSIRLEQWTKKMQWEHTRKLVGDSTAETGSIAEPQRQSITNFIALLVNSKQSDLDSPIPSDVWDLGPNLSLQISHANIQVSYTELSQRRFFIIEPRQSPNHAVWTLAIPDPITTVMCLQHNWGSDAKEIALALLQRGMAFRTLQRMTVAPNLWRPLTELHTYTLGHRPSPFRAIYADYVIYEQLCHEFMNRP